jgi:hypothetical protein
VLWQPAIGLRLGWRLCLRLRLCRHIWRRSRHLDDRGRGARLRDGCWSCPNALARRYRDATSYDRGSCNTQPGPSDEIASGDNRPSVLLNWLATDRSGRLVAS